MSLLGRLCEIDGVCEQVDDDLRHARRVKVSPRQIVRWVQVESPGYVAGFELAFEHVNCFARDFGGLYEDWGDY